MTTNRNEWSSLTSLQIGRYAEYLTKMEFTLHGFDVYTAEVDDKGIDFVIRGERSGSVAHPDPIYYDVQVKAARQLNYVFFRKDKSVLRKNLLAAVVLFEDGKPPDLYPIPATKWNAPNNLLVDRGYEGLKSEPEWGLNLSRRNLDLLEDYRLEKTVGEI